jgi:hypothetical protein
MQPKPPQKSFRNRFRQGNECQTEKQQQETLYNTQPIQKSTWITNAIKKLCFFAFFLFSNYFMCANPIDDTIKKLFSCFFFVLVRAFPLYFQLFMRETTKEKVIYLQA